MVDAVKEGILSFQGGWLRIIVESEVAHVPPQEHAQQCAAEQIVDVPVPQLVEDVEFAHVVRHERLHWPIFLSSIGKAPQKQTTFISPKGKEKRIDHIPTKKKAFETR